jgi:hypothetical protein
MRSLRGWLPRLAVVGVLAGALVAIAGGSGASAARLHRFTAHAKLAILTIRTAGGITTGVTGGSITGGPFGRDGAVVLPFRVSGSKIVGTGIEYGRAGRFSGPFTVSFKTLPGGGMQYSGSGKVTGGTGSYRGAHGTTTVTGSDPGGAGAIGSFTIRYAVVY